MSRVATGAAVTTHPDYPACDGLPEDRVVCAECVHCDAGSYRCRRYNRSALLDLPLRCLGFMPVKRLADQRPGSERWPTLKRDIEEMRAAGQAYPT